MKCHYEVLNVAKDADDGEIKTAYRKLALKWHPDKNLDNVEHAREQFQLVQQAYEVLSDRQERAWYDNHREQILRGANSEFKDDSLDVYQFFTSSCFKGHGDDELGFYTVYRKIFEQIAKEDIEFVDDKEEFMEMPNFGTSVSDYEEIVAPFYSYWSSYSTKKSYTWLDPYSITEARGDRRVFRIIEKENKKVRLKAKKERNEEVRALVAFVRKRDKRVQAYSKLLEAKKLENQQKREQISLQKKLERIKQLDNSGNQAEWSKFDNVKSELEQIEKSLAEQFGEEITASESEEDEDETLNNLYCVACNKIFKTPKAFENHESSKKHKENVERLKEVMQEEDQNGDMADSDELLELGTSSEEDTNDTATTAKQKKKKKGKSILKIDTPSESGDELPPQLNTTPSDDDFDFGLTKRQKKKIRKSTQSTKTNDISSCNVNNENVVLVHDEEKLTKRTSKKGKENKKQNKSRVDEEINVDTGHCCVTCKANFESKNKLFDHLKKSGHSVYLPHSIKSKKKNVKE